MFQHYNTSINRTTISEATTNLKIGIRVQIFCWAFYICSCGPRREQFYPSLQLPLPCLCLQVMSRHSWKDQAAQPKIKYFTQVKARPPTFVAFVGGKTHLLDTDIRFLTRSLKEDFNLGGIPVRIMQRSMSRKDEINGSSPKQSSSRPVSARTLSDKRTVAA